MFRPLEVFQLKCKDGWLKYLLRILTRSTFEYITYYLNSGHWSIFWCFNFFRIWKECLILWYREMIHESASDDILFSAWENVVSIRLQKRDKNVVHVIYNMLSVCSAYTTICFMVRLLRRSTKYTGAFDHLNMIFADCIYKWPPPLWN